MWVINVDFHSSEPNRLDPKSELAESDSISGVLRWPHAFGFDSTRLSLADAKISKKTSLASLRTRNPKTSGAPPLKIPQCSRPMLAYLWKAICGKHPAPHIFVNRGPPFPLVIRRENSGSVLDSSSLAHCGGSSTYIRSTAVSICGPTAGDYF